MLAQQAGRDLDQAFGTGLGPQGIAQFQQKGLPCRNRAQDLLCPPAGIDVHDDRNGARDLILRIKKRHRGGIGPDLVAIVVCIKELRARQAALSPQRPCAGKVARHDRAAVLVPGPPAPAPVRIARGHAPARREPVPCGIGQKHLSLVAQKRKAHRHHLQHGGLQPLALLELFGELAVTCPALAQGRFRRLAPRNVAPEDRKSFRHGIGPHLEPARRSAFPSVEMIERDRCPFLHGAPEKTSSLAVLASGIDLPVPAPQDLLARAGLETQRRIVEGEDAEVVVQKPEGLVHAVQHVLEPGLAFAQPRLGALAALLGLHLAGGVADKGQYAAHLPPLVPHGRVGEIEPGLLPWHVGAREAELLATRHGLLARPGLLEQRQPSLAHIGPGIVGRAAKRRRMALPDAAGIGVVVDHDRVVAPQQAHGRPRAEHQVHECPEIGRPFPDRPERGGCPVVRADEVGHLAAVQGPWGRKAVMRHHRSVVLPGIPGVAVHACCTFSRAADDRARQRMAVAKPSAEFQPFRCLIGRHLGTGSGHLLLSPHDTAVVTLPEEALPEAGDNQLSLQELIMIFVAARPSQSGGVGHWRSIRHGGRDAQGRFSRSRSGPRAFWSRLQAFAPDQAQPNRCQLPEMLQHA